MRKSDKVLAKQIIIKNMFNKVSYIELKSLKWTWFDGGIKLDRFYGAKIIIIPFKKGLLLNFQSVTIN